MEENLKIKCSVGILTFNSAGTLRKSLESVKNFAEIVICDGGSSDNTLDIAREYNCKIFSQDKKFQHPDGRLADFAGVRNQLIEYSTYDWFAFVDSDEWFSEELVAEITKIVYSDIESVAKVYKVPRKLIRDGVVIDCASSYPNYQLRFFNKKYVEGFTKKVHEKIIPKKDVRVGALNFHVMVPMVDDETIFKKQKYYNAIERKKLEEINVGQILISLKYDVKSILGRLYRITKNEFFCKGNKMPIRRELMALRNCFSLGFLKLRVASSKLFNSVRL